MEDRLKSIFEALTEKEIKELIDNDGNNMSFEMDKKTLERIKNMTFKKAGLSRPSKVKKTTPIMRKLAAVAAILILMFGVLSAIGFDNVTAAVNRFFKFIPGFGIVTEEDPIVYAIDDRDINVENDVYKMTLKNAVATSDSVTVFMEVVYKELEKPGLVTSKQEILKELERASQRPGLYLYSENGKVQANNMHMGGGGTDYYRENIVSTFYLENEQIRDGSEFKLSYDDIGLSLDLKFIAYNSFSELLDIGPTDVHNDISITAIPSYEDDALMIELYPVNNSNYEIYSLVNRLWKEQPVADEELHLETEEGTVTYRLPEGGSIGYYRNFYFDVTNEQSSMTLKIPYIIVKSKEKAEKTVPIPEQGNIKSVDIPFKFDDGTMRLIEVERIKNKEEGFDREADGVKLTFTLENDKENMKLYIATPDQWKPYSSAYKWEYDKDNNMAVLWYYPENIKTGRLNLSLDEPLYVLTDPYIINLDSYIFSLNSD